MVSRVMKAVISILVFMLLTQSVYAYRGFFHEYFYPSVMPLDYQHTQYTYIYPYPHPYPQLWKTPRLVDSDVKNFSRPMYCKERLDFCYMAHRFCGRAAANAFCRKQGYRYATRFFIERDVGLTKNIYDNYVMPHASRDGFKSIRCRT